MGNPTEATTTKVEIRTSPISGKGTFAKQRIAAGEHILTLSGEYILTNDINSISRARGWRIEDPLQIDDELFLALDLPSKLINHSCNPNVGIRNKSDLYALRDIQVNDEIAYDYSSTCGVNDQMEMECCCHSMQCRKLIGNIMTVSQDVLLSYFEMNALPEFIKQQLQKIGRL